MSETECPHVIVKDVDTTAHNGITDELAVIPNDPAGKNVSPL